MARPERIRGFSYIGFCRYSLTFCTYRRTPLFSDAKNVAMAHEQIRRTADAEQFAILAYCFMPDHIHLVLEGTHESSDLRRFMKISRQRVAYFFRTQRGINPTWQGGCYERILRSTETTEVVVRYVLENPVRAGIVNRAEDYSHSGPVLARALLRRS